MDEFVPDSRYVNLGQIGQGGMGSVYRVLDRLTGKVVALKQVISLDNQPLFDPETSNKEARLALAHEFKLLASLRHPHVISVLDYGFDRKNQPFFTMDYLENALPLKEAAINESLLKSADYVIQMLLALAYVHRRGILHRDLKPGNVLVKEGNVKVLDFGLSITREQSKADPENLSGTLAYIAPELIGGTAASEASDMFAVGVMAYELFTGEHPFESESVMALVKNILESSPDLSLLSARYITTRRNVKNQIPMEDEDEEKTDDLRETREMAPLPHVTGGEGMPTTDLLALVISRLLDKNPLTRYSNANQVIAHLCEALNIPLPPESADIRESFVQAARFVGRELEMQQLIDAIQNSLEGKGSAFLVAGESGVGKSRLLDEVRIHALVDGALVMRGRATRERGAPYNIWREVVRHVCLLTDLTDFEASVLKTLVTDIDVLLEHEIPDAPPIDAKAAQERLLTVVESVFRKQTQPIVLMLEDLQWAEESLVILNRLTGIVDELPLVIVGNYRDDESPDLPDKLPAMKIVKLDRLTVDDIRKLGSSILGTAKIDTQIIELLERETEGNAFFLVEVMNALAEHAGSLDEVTQVDLPETVSSRGIQQIIQQRLDRIPEWARFLLKAAAVFGRTLDTNVLGVVNLQTGKPVKLDDWLTICSNYAVLDVLDNRWQFAHDKLREKLLAEIGADERKGLHETLAEAIETLYINDSAHIAQLAYHWSHTDNIAKAMFYLDKAGKQAVDNFSNTEAISFLSKADALDGAKSSAEDRERHANRQMLLGLAHLGAGQLSDSRGYLEQALSYMGYRIHTKTGGLVVSLLRQLARQIRHRMLGVRPTRDPEKRDHILRAARIMEKLGEIYLFLGQSLHSSYYSIRNLNLCEQVEPSPELARAYANMTIIASIIPLRKLAYTYSRNAQKIGTTVGDKATLCRVLTRANGLFEGSMAQWDTTLPAMRRAIELGEQVGDNRILGESLVTSQAIFTLVAEFEECEKIGRRAVEIAYRGGDPQQHAIGLNYPAFTYVCRNRFDDAYDNLKAAETLIIDRPDLSTTILFNTAVQAWMYVRMGDYSLGREMADRAVGYIEKNLRAIIIGHYFSFTATAEAYMGLLEYEDTPENRANVERALGYLKAFVKRGDIGLPTMALLEGRYAWVKGEHDAAKTHWQQALTHAEAFRMPYEIGRAHHYLARTYSPDTAEFNMHRDAADAVFDRLGIDRQYPIDNLG